MMLVRRCEMLPIECIVRGHLAGSAWKEYRERGTMHGAPLPAGLREADAAAGARCSRRRPRRRAATHDENITFDDAVALVGGERAEEARALSLAVFDAGGRATPPTRGIVIADTKFELGVLDGELVLADEVLTPDSSRFWAGGLRARARRRRATTSSRSATGWRRPAGTRRRRRPRCRPRSSPRPGPATSRSTSVLSGRSVRRLAGCSGVTAGHATMAA